MSNVELYLKQKKVLDTFLERNAISKEQYEKSLGDLTEKMHMQDVLKDCPTECKMQGDIFYKETGDE